jgi:hypothetical protein
MNKNIGSMNDQNDPSFSVKATVTKPAKVKGQTVLGDDTGIEARSSYKTVRISCINKRASIRASTTSNVSSSKNL